MQNSISAVDFSKITTKKELSASIEDGLCSVFCDIFKEYPYGEKITLEEATSLFTIAFTKCGDIYIARNRKDRKIIGFFVGVSYPRSKHYFIKELGVLAEYRRKGIASTFLNNAIEEARNKGFSKIHLMTNINNLPAINLYLKSHFRISSTINVPSIKLSNNIEVEERYIMSCNLNFDNNIETILERVAVCDPTGNVTAIVFDKVEYEDYRKYTKLIMTALPNVEQVGFIKRSQNGLPRLEMMGQELCGNALLSVAKILVNKEVPNVSIETDVLDNPVELILCDDEVKAELPIVDPEIINIEDGKLVKLPGIYHLILIDRKPSSKEARRLAGKLSRTIDVSAIGIIFVDKESNYITPYVYVRNTNTLIQEQSCASGSLALGIIKSQGGKGKTIIVNQPSLGKLKVYSSKFKSSIQSKVDLIGTYRINVKKNTTNVFNLEDIVI